MSYSYKMSIIVPVYNAEKYLNECLESIVHQTMDHSDYEVLLINDGSRDQSAEICTCWKEKYTNIFYYEKENSGVSSTRNFGLEKSKGKYILFLDSDDYLGLDVLEKIYNFFEKQEDKIDLVTYPIVYVNQKGKKTKHFRYQKLYEKGTSVYDLDQWYHCIQTTINVCVKNDKKHFFDIHQSFSEDEKFNTGILMVKRKIGFVSDAIYYYRRHDTNVTKNKENLLRNFDIINSYYEESLKKYDGHPYIQNLLLNQFRFRIEDGNLYGTEKEKKEIIRLLSFVDIKNIYEMPFLNVWHKLFLLELMSAPLQVKFSNSIQIVCNNFLFLEEQNPEVVVTNLELKKDSVTFIGTILSAAFLSDRKVECYIELKDKNEKLEVKQIKLEPSSFSYYKSPLKTNKFQSFCISFSISEILEVGGFLKIENKKFPLTFDSSIFVSKNSYIGNKEIVLGKKIWIKKKGILKKYPYTHWKMYLLHFLKHFFYPFSEITLYVESEKGIVYEYYKKDEVSKKKFYFSNIHSLKYQLLLLKCKQLVVSNLNISSYLPFGKNNDKYSLDYQFKILYCMKKDEVVDASYMGKEYHPKVLILPTSPKQKNEMIKNCNYVETDFCDTFDKII